MYDTLLIMISETEILETFSYKVKNSTRAKRLTITVRSDGSCVVTKPVRMSLASANNYVQGKLHWIVEKIKILVQRKKHRKTKTLSGEYRSFKKTAYELASSRLDFFNQYYGFTWHNIVIRNQKTRWGSCSSQGNLNFNYKIALLPSHLADYIVVHELCHLSQFNHSKQFWNLVAETVPDYKQCKKELKQYGLDLG